MTTVHGAGSSPHTRGAPDAGVHGARHARIIPAYAGSTWHASNRPVKAPDHPRIRGEHRVLGRLRVPERGSSPHTRGAPPRSLSSAPRDRIIPAYAGSTCGPTLHGRGLSDHPRIRGEHQLALMKPGDLVGSSPHTRGARGTRRPGAFDSRIIPAYAGSTPVWYSSMPLP